MHDVFDAISTLCWLAGMVGSAYFLIFGKDAYVRLVGLAALVATALMTYAGWPG